MNAAYLSTRISLLKPRLWTPEQVRQLIDASPDVLAERLRRRGLARLVGEGDDDPRSLEARIVAILLEETRVLLRPLTGSARDFILYWIERFEVSNVKSLIRERGRMKIIDKVTVKLNEKRDVYEALLSYQGFFAKTDLYEVKRRDEDNPDPLDAAFVWCAGQGGYGFMTFDYVKTYVDGGYSTVAMRLD